MNDEDLFIFFTQILEKLESIDVQLKRLNYKQACYKPPGEQVYCEPEYCPPQVYCESVYCESVYCEPEYCEPLYYSCVYNPYYDYTLDYLVPIDECIYTYYQV